MVVSDHGCSTINRKVSMERFLQERGFLVLKDSKAAPSCFARDGYERIDWDKTKVWLHAGAGAGRAKILLGLGHVLQDCDYNSYIPP